MSVKRRWKALNGKKGVDFEFFSLIDTLTCIILCVTLLFGSAPMVAAWSGDPTINTPICTAPADQETPQIVSDGTGGAIIAWIDIRNGNKDIYAQRVNASGVRQWIDDGVPICTAANIQNSLQTTADGAGGAIIAWQDYRSNNSKVYVQRVDASGSPQWTADGVIITSSGSGHFGPQLIGDGAGGAIVTYVDGVDIYAQRVNASGVVQWSASGSPICTAIDSQEEPQLTDDGAAGAIITWVDYRSSGNGDVYAQRVNGSGVVQWTVNGVAICTAGDREREVQLTGDGANGAFIVWQDGRNGYPSNFDIYARRVDSNGIVQWTNDGVAICTAPDTQRSAQLISDGAGGAIMTWYDRRSGNPDWDIYAQRINSSGTLQWAANGQSICTAVNSQGVPQLISDASGGAIITWFDLRNGVDDDIYAQRVNALGAAQWTNNGIVVSAATRSQAYPEITTDGAGGAIITWHDGRNGLNNDIFAQRVESNAALPIHLSKLSIE